MKVEFFEIRYGGYENYKTVKTTDYEQALRMYNKYKAFAENHGLTWIVSLFENLGENKYWLIKSETINGEIVTYEDLIKCGVR